MQDCLRRLSHGLSYCRQLAILHRPKNVAPLHGGRITFSDTMYFANPSAGFIGTKTAEMTQTGEHYATPGEYLSRQLTPQILDRWQKMHNLRKHHTLKQIAAMFNVSLWTVHKCLVKYQSHLLRNCSRESKPQPKTFAHTTRGNANH